MTRPRIPLYGQILFWFFLNLALVTAVVFLVVKVQFGIDPRELLWGRTEQRFATVATALSADLRESPQRDWEKVLARAEEEHGVSLGVYRASDWGLMAGSGGEFPVELREPLRVALPPRERGGGRPGPGRGNGEPPPRGDDGFGVFLPPRRDGPARRGPLRGGLSRGVTEGGDPEGGGPEGGGPEGGGPPRGDGGNRVARVFHVGMTGNGARYLAAAVVSLGSREFRHPPEGIVVAQAESLGGNGVFFDWRPWSWALGGVLFVSALVWLPFVMRLTRRLQRLTAAAETMAEGNFAVEVASNRGDELGRLSRAVQRMAAQLDDYVKGQKRFLGDIAHELCSPLARLRMALGVLESQIPEADHDKLATLNEEAGELGLLVNELLDFSRASLKPEALPRQELDLRGFLEELAAREAPGAPCTITVEDGLILRSNPDLLKRALGNVLRNAVRYAGPAGPIELRAAARGSSVTLQIRDRGPGIPAEWLDRVFEPFSRPERARTREGGGAGLGLAIAKTCIDSLGGTILARNRQGGGLSIDISLPQGP